MAENEKSENKRCTLFDKPGDKICSVCGKPYEWRLATGGSGKNAWCEHDDKVLDRPVGDKYGMTSSDHKALERARPRGLGPNERPAKGNDGIIRIVERG